MNTKLAVIIFCAAVIIIIVGLAIQETYGHEPEPLVQIYAPCK